MVVNKPPGVDSQRSSRASQTDGTPHWLDELSERAPHGLRTVHRLDKNATGALLLAKNVQLAHDLAQQFTRRSVDKVYLAVVRGHLGSSGQHGSLETRLSISDGRVSVAGSSRDAKHAVSSWELVATSAVGPDLSLVRLTLVTGFKHQLRVQLATELGTPVLGDHLYGPRAKVAHGPNPASHSRLFLHASHVAVTRHRPTGQRLRLGVTAPLPSYFSALCDQAGLALSDDERRGALYIDGKRCDLRPGERVQLSDGVWMPGDL